MLFVEKSMFCWTDTDYMMACLNELSKIELGFDAIMAWNIKRRMRSAVGRYSCVYCSSKKHRAGIESKGTWGGIKAGAESNPISLEALVGLIFQHRSSQLSESLDTLSLRLFVAKLIIESGAKNMFVQATLLWVCSS